METQSFMCSCGPQIGSEAKLHLAVVVAATLGHLLPISGLLLGFLERASVATGCV